MNEKHKEILMQQLSYIYRQVEILKIVGNNMSVFRKSSVGVVLYKSVLQGCILNLAKLFDPPETTIKEKDGKITNLYNIVISRNQEIRYSEVEKIVSKLRYKLRNKIIAHNDENTLLKIESNNKNEVTIKEIDEVLNYCMLILKNETNKELPNKNILDKKLHNDMECLVRTLENFDTEFNEL